MGGNASSPSSTVYSGAHLHWMPGEDEMRTSTSSNDDRTSSVYPHHHQGFFATSKSVSGMEPVSSMNVTMAPTSMTSTSSRSKIFGLATLRRKFLAIPSKMRKAAGGLGRNQSKEHARTIRTLLSNWSVHEIHALVEEYETLMTIRDLTIEAEIARHEAPSVAVDLLHLFENKTLTDAEIVFKKVTFPIHRCILASRCRFFRGLFASQTESPYRVNLPHAPEMSASLFAVLLRFLYSGELTADELSGEEVEILARLTEEFGTPNPIRVDLQSMLSNGSSCDTVLVFTASGHPIAKSPDGISTWENAGQTEKVTPHSTLTPQSTPTLPKFFLNLNSPAVSPTTSHAQASSADTPTQPGIPHPLPQVQPVALLCHRAVLSARSPFFDSMIKRRLKNLNDSNENGNVLQILIDEKVIPRKYAVVIMEAIYTDKVDLSKISAGSSTSGCSQVPTLVYPNNGGLGSPSSGSIMSNSLKEAAAISTGKGQHSLLDDAMELYQIGQFIALEILSQQSEDIIVSHLSLDNLPKILSWSSESHGSTWVKRQCLRFLREEFTAVVNSTSTLLELTEADMISLLESDFLQASEQDILAAVLKWSEHQLIRRAEEREPNIVSGTTHSITRRGLRRRDVNDSDLRDIASPLMALVRLPHVLPPNSETLQFAQQRGLLSTPPAHLLGPNFQPSQFILTPALSSVHPPVGIYTGAYHCVPDCAVGGNGTETGGAARMHTTLGNILGPRCYVGGGRHTTHAKTTPPPRPNNSDAGNTLLLSSSSSAAWLSRFPRSMTGAGRLAMGGPTVDRPSSTLKPRLFFPYFEEAKLVLQEQLADLQEDLEVVRLRMLRCCMSHHFPDTLYMVSPVGHDAANSTDSNNLSRMDPCEPGVVANSELFIPDVSVMMKLLSRMTSLILHPLTQRALSMISGTRPMEPSVSATRRENATERNAVFSLLQLRSIRELGLPDQVIHVLKTPALFYPDDTDVLDATKKLNSLMMTPIRRSGPPIWGPIVGQHPQEPVARVASDGRQPQQEFRPPKATPMNFVDVAHASLSPSASIVDCADFPSSILDPWETANVSSGHLRPNQPPCAESLRIEDDNVENEGAVGGIDQVMRGVGPDLTIGTSNSRSLSAECVSTAASSSPETSSSVLTRQEARPNLPSHGSLNRFHITHYGGLIQTGNNPESCSAESNDSSTIDVKRNNQFEYSVNSMDSERLSRSEASSHLRSSRSLQAPSGPSVSPHHHFHHHLHTCNHHAHPNLLIPSSNCLSKLNRVDAAPADANPAILSFPDIASPPSSAPRPLPLSPFSPPSSLDILSSPPPPGVLDGNSTTRDFSPRSSAEPGRISQRRPTLSEDSTAGFEVLEHPPQRRGDGVHRFGQTPVTLMRRSQTQPDHGEEKIDDEGLFV